MRFLTCILLNYTDTKRNQLKKRELAISSQNTCVSPKNCMVEPFLRLEINVYSINLRVYTTSCFFML